MADFTNFFQIGIDQLFWFPQSLCPHREIRLPSLVKERINAIKPLFFFLCNGVVNYFLVPRGKFNVKFPQGSWDDFSSCSDALEVRTARFHCQPPTDVTGHNSVDQFKL